MHRHGKTAAGTERWRCPSCKGTGVKTRKDTSLRHVRELFRRWITGTATMTDIAQEKKATRQTVARWFEPLWREATTCPIPSSTQASWLMVDGIYLQKRMELALIARTDQGEIFWDFAPYESSWYWEKFFLRLPVPDIVISDGQKGLQKAIQDHWPDTALQRCIFHVMQLATIRLTRHPKTVAGKEMRILMGHLPEVHTHARKERWIALFEQWEHRHEKLLKERTYGDGSSSRRWWYTHRNLRAVRSLIRNALPHLFTYLNYPGMPRTTNHVEGGLNARLAELVHRHRGLNINQKRVLAAEFLRRTSKKNPTRNVT